MIKLLLTTFILKLYARINIFNKIIILADENDHQNENFYDQLFIFGGH